MLRIGIDFDNTIACYDRAFGDVAVLMELAPPAVASSKVDVKAQVLTRPDGDLAWQRLQGQVYGKHMMRAEVFPGFHEFLYLSRLRGHSVFVVSHKTEFGHFDEERVPLREQALLWLKAFGIVVNDSAGLRAEDVFFESTREKKIDRIRELGCTHFIDDLLEVFEAPLFPAGATKILFRPSHGNLDGTEISAAASWREIAKAMLGEWTEEEICRAAQAVFPGQGIARAELRKGRGNSRIYELTGAAGVNYALKVYPDRQSDSRPRLQTEIAACHELAGRGYPVAEAVAADRHLDWGLYRWIAGTAIEPADVGFVDDATDFVRRLYRDSRAAGSFDGFPPASEACLSGPDIAAQIELRLGKLEAVKSEHLSDFLGSGFRPEFAAAVRRAKELLGDGFSAALPRELQMPSPSDFGSHNALKVGSGEVRYFDFEYFGWDDPVKLVSDFYWHPGMSLSAELRHEWLENSLEIFSQDSSFPGRLNAYLPLYGLKWCLILLNEYLKTGAAQRLHADPGKGIDLAGTRIEQLDKSRALLKEIQETTREHG